MTRFSVVLTILVATLSFALPPVQAQNEAAAPPPAASASPTAESSGPTSSGDSPPVAEQESPANEAPASGVLHDVLHSGALGLMVEGGIFMWFILPLGIVAFGVIIERYRSLKMLSTDTQAVRAQVRDLLENDQIEEALTLCEGQQGPVPAILAAGLRKYLILRRLGYDPAKIEEQVVKAMDDYGVHIVAALEKHLPSLATVASAAPMLGFLGTVSGMIGSFNTIVAEFGQQNIVVAAAGGISEALLTTAFGLIVGIPAYVAFNYFTSVINRFVLEVEESATELIETVTLQMALRKREAEEAGYVEAAAT